MRRLQCRNTEGKTFSQMSDETVKTNRKTILMADWWAGLLQHNKEYLSAEMPCFILMAEFDRTFEFLLDIDNARIKLLKQSK